jgi:gliding motility-associated-like protein
MNSKLLRLRCNFFVVALVLFVTINATAQIGQNNFTHNMPKPLGTTWLDMSFNGNNNGLAVGNAATIARTTDAGATWTYGVVMFNAASGLKQRPTLNDVHYVTPTVAYASGDSGMLLKSVDAGVNWTQINNPLYSSARNINAVWFINKDTGYIGGQGQIQTITTANASSPDAAPKLYFTRNGGNTWDSLNAPIGPQSWVGFIQSPTNPPVKLNANAIGKEIFRIQFVNDSVGYVVGSGSQTASGAFSQPYPGGSTTIPANLGGLIWKFKSGVLTDYSLTKERLGYSGAGVFGTITATTTYNVTSLPQQSIKAMWPINDSLLLITTFNNGIAVRIKTGVNDSTIFTPFVPFSTAPGTPSGPLVNAKGKYEILQYTNAPTNLTFNQAVPPVIPAQVLISSNMVNMRRAADGKIYVTSSGGKVGVTPDNGTTWSMLQATPLSNLGNTLQLFAAETTPNGNVHVMGTNGIHSIGANGTSWSTNYSVVSLNAGLNKMEFADCNNGAVLGNQGVILATTDGGKTWTDRTIASFGPTVSILGMSFPDAGRLYFTATNGNIYSSPDIGTTVNLLFTPSRISTNYGLATSGTGATTRIWATSYRSSDVVNRAVVYRSLNNGATWDTIKAFSTMGTNVPQMIKFVDDNTGYMAAGKSWLWKTTDGGTTWTNISPDPALTASTAFGSLHSFGVFGNTIYYFALVSTTRYLYKSTDGGATWSANIFPITVANEPVTNIGDFVMHDANNFVALTGPNKILITNDGGATWRFDEAPSGAGFNAGQFVPKVVPAGTPMANRKMFMTGNQILEYGVKNLTNVSSAEALVASCTSTNNGSVTVNASNGIAPYNYKLDGGAFQSSNVFNNVSVGNHTVTIKDGSCGPDLVKNITIAAKPTPSINAGPDQVAVNGDVVYLQGIGINNPTSLTWSPAASISSGVNQYLAITKPTVTTNYTLTVVDANGCSASDQALVTVYPYCVKTMDAFTPNGDGQNDKWLVTLNGGCTQNVAVAVFNRYGTEVYRNENYTNNWDGTYKGKQIPDGTYYYVNTYKLVTGSTVVLKGDVTILR